MYKILIVEDDLDLAHTLKFALEIKGYDITACINSTQAHMELDRPYDFYLIDIKLPDGSGFEICKRIREKNNHSPIMLISSLEDEDTILKGYYLNVDDYIVKPFRLNVLLSKIKGLLNKGIKHSDNLNCLGYLLNIEERCLIRNERKIKLTPSEISILKELFSNYPKIVSRNILLNSLWIANGKESSDDSLTVRISILNKKLKEEGTLSIVSVYGGGYSLNGELNYEKKNI